MYDIRNTFVCFVRTFVISSNLNGTTLLPYLPYLPWNFWGRGSSSSCSVSFMTWKTEIRQHHSRATWCFHHFPPVQWEHPEIPSILSPPSLTAAHTLQKMSWGWRPNQKGAQTAFYLTVFQVTLDHFSTKQSQSPRLCLFTSKTTNQLVPRCCMLLQCARLEQFDQFWTPMSHAGILRISQNIPEFSNP